jgi:hypothetical protein
VLASAALFLVTGCERAGEKIAAMFSPKTVEEVTAAVNEKLAQHKFKDAQIEGEDFLGGKEDTSGHLAWALAKASAQIGQPDVVIKYTAQAIRAKAVTGPEAMIEPLLEPVRTDIRFVSLLAGIGKPESRAAQTNTPNSKQDAERKESSTVINMGAQGTEVRAGDIVIKLSN